MKALIKTILYQPLFNALIFFVWLIPGHNVAWAIIILTVLIRLALLPSSLKATRQQKRMRDLQPEIKALQDKYKNDKQKQAQALMDFYKEKNIHPMGACLPMLIQLPILIVLYYVFQAGLSVDRFDLLYGFMPRPEAIQTVFLGINLAQPDKFILPIIAGVLQFIQARQITPQEDKENKDKSAEMQAMISKQMLYLMPVFTIFIAGRLPAALPLYWIVTSAFTIIQQWWVLKEKDSFSKAKKSNNKQNNTIKKGGVEVTVRRKGA